MTSEEKKYRIIEILTEILKWIKVTSIPQVRKLLLDILRSNEEKIAYHFSDGRSSQEVAKFAGVGYVTITRWWKSWVRAGIAESVSVKGGERARRMFSLEDFNIEVPSLKEPKSTKKEAKASIEDTSEEKPTQGETPEEEKT